MRSVLAISLLMLSHNVLSSDLLNEVIWKSEPITVSKYSVIEVPEQCPETARIDLKLPTNPEAIHVDDGKAYVRVLFTASFSPDRKYWVIDSSTQCESDKYECMSSEYLTFKPETKATVSCMKYKGMTIGLGENGKPVITSDIPEHQQALNKMAENES
ncbi:exported hypothetical protein [Vibrio nigripulchritudo SOn1]|uniref:Uncharacterized protein n=1 Tax=Vibrio nigripulchritudo SOn1 TaxID=1238450 RepID=A0AAV2VVH8_9VIBR|nr:hypothetical protein [Vibrio nigripulchritudo]CCO48445.1 exported hypothetical protein [Vibrio nigripulchritudo SOn1]